MLIACKAFNLEMNIIRLCYSMKIEQVKLTYGKIILSLELAFRI